MKVVNDILFTLLKENFWKFFSIFALILIGVGLEAVSPFAYKILIDNVLGGKPLETEGFPFVDTLLAAFPTPEMLGGFVVILFFITNILLSIVDFIQAIVTKAVIQKGIYDFSKIAFRSLESFNIGFFRKIDIGDYIYRLSSDVYAIGELIEDAILPIITSSLFLIVTTVIMFFINVQLTLISFLTVPFLAAALYVFNKKIGRASLRSEIANSTVYSFMQQSLSQLKIIQAYSKEQFISQEFNRTESEALKAELRLFKVNFMYDLIVGLAIAIIYSTIFAYGITAVFSGELTAGLLIVFIYYLDNLTNPMISIADSAYSLKQSKVRIGRLSDFFKTETHLEDTGKVEEVKDTSITFENITLTGQENFSVLSNISFKIPANKITIIAGISGSGKTSLISLIPRLIEKPTTGRILLGGTDITQYTIKTLRDNVAYMAQETTLFNHTVHNIISFGKSNATYEEIQNAAKLACAEDFIVRHPQGYNFKVGEGGNYLSGGQRQRLMLARAFIKNANILILDEPFSNLDEETKRIVWKNIKTFGKGKTVIIVTNILDIMNEADYVILLNNGTLKYEGDFKHLQHKTNLASLLLE